MSKASTYRTIGYALLGFIVFFGAIEGRISNLLMPGLHPGVQALIYLALGVSLIYLAVRVILKDSAKGNHDNAKPERNSSLQAPHPVTRADSAA